MKAWRVGESRRSRGRAIGARRTRLTAHSVQADAPSPARDLVNRWYEGLPPEEREGRNDIRHVVQVAHQPRVAGNCRRPGVGVGVTLSGGGDSPSE